MPIKSQPRKTAKPRPKLTPVRRGSRTVAIVLVGIVVVICVSLYLLLSKGPYGLKPTGGPSTGSDSAASSVNQVAEGSQLALAKAKLELQSIDDKEIIKIIIDKPAGTEGNGVSYRYEWMLNGQPAGDGGDRLSGFKRGDRVSVKVTPFDGEKAGATRTLDTLIQNTAPRVVETKDAQFDGKSLTYQVKGIDPDGDQLTYALEEPPDGMTIDPQTGTIKWQLKEQDYGERTIKVKVSDGKGGFAKHSVKVDLPKPTEAKKPSGENQK